LAAFLVHQRDIVLAAIKQHHFHQWSVRVKHAGILLDHIPDRPRGMFAQPFAEYLHRIGHKGQIGQAAFERYRLRQ
jgi:hypothetical protein